MNDFNTYREMIIFGYLVSGRAAVDKKASYVPIRAIIVYLFKKYFIIIENFVFSGLLRNRCMYNLSVSKSCFLISEFLFCVVVGIYTGDSN